MNIHKIMARTHGFKKIKKDRSVNFEMFDALVASLPLGLGTFAGAVINHYLVKREVLLPFHLGVIGGIIGLAAGIVYLFYRYMSIGKNIAELKRKRRKNRSDFDFGPLR